MEPTNTTAIAESTPREIQVQAGGAKLTKQAIASITEQMNLATELVTKLLDFGIDFGITPGTNSPGLWDAGAQKIIRAFQCHANHIVLNDILTEDLVAWTIEAQLINSAGEVVGSGMGHANSWETKNRYRWADITEALRVGNTEEDLRELKTRQKYNSTDIQYRIINPDLGDLVHTLLVMASKRAEVDAAKSLPGVSSALRAKFDDKGEKKPVSAKTLDGDDITLPIFWAILKGSGVSEKEAHTILKVQSVNDWTASGKTLRDGLSLILKTAVTTVRDMVKKQAFKAEPEKAAPETVKSTAMAAKTPQQVTSGDVSDIFHLISLAHKYWDMTEQEVFEAIGYLNRYNFTEAGVQTPWEAWLSLLEIKSA